MAGCQTTQQYTLTIPVLVHHHDSEEHAQSEKEDTVDVMRYSITNCDAEGEQDDTADDVESNAKDNVANHPAVVKSTDHKDQL